jgi:hypothetical protein
LVSTKLPAGIALFSGWNNDAIHLGDEELGFVGFSHRHGLFKRPNDEFDEAMPELGWHGDELGAS